MSDTENIATENSPQASQIYGANNLTPKKYCLITGASSGIGAAFANLMAERGYDLILVARREDRLQTLAEHLAKKWGAEGFIIAQDLHEHNAVDNIINALNKNNLKVDALINNAGYGLSGGFLDTKWEDQDNFLQIMMRVPTELCHKLMPSMKERGFGRIINIASLAGYLPGSVGHTLYPAVKSYIIKMSQSLNLEAKEFGINVTALCPGMTYTEFHDVNGTRGLVSKLPKLAWQDAYEVALEGYDAVQKNQTVHISGRFNRFLKTIIRLMPENLLLKITAANSHHFHNK